MSAGDSGPPTLLPAMAALVGQLVVADDLTEVLDHLVERSRDLFALDAVGLLVAGSTGRLQLMSVTASAGQVPDWLRGQHHDGPVVEAWRTGRTVLVRAADEPDRWPAWTAHAEALGIHLAAGVPLCAGGMSFGAVVLLTARPQQLPDDTLCAAEVLAHVAALVIAHDRTRQRDKTLIQQLETALSSRVVIEQAKGVLAERGGIALPDAFELLRRYSRSRGLRVAVVADLVVTGRLDLRPH